VVDNLVDNLVDKSELQLLEDLLKGPSSENNVPEQDIKRCLKSYPPPNKSYPPLIHQVIHHLQNFQLRHL